MDVKDQLLQSVISGKSFNQISNELIESYNVGRYERMRLIRTETSYVFNQADLDDSKRIGIKAKKFNATLDMRTSEICREHDGLIIPIDEIEIGVIAPPLHPHCRSHLSDMLEDWDYDTEEELEKLIEESTKKNKEDTDIKNINVRKIKPDTIKVIEKPKFISSEFPEELLKQYFDGNKDKLNSRYKTFSEKDRKAFDKLSNELSELSDKDINLLKRYTKYS